MFINKHFNTAPHRYLAIGTVIPIVLHISHRLANCFTNDTNNASLFNQAFTTTR